MTAVVSILRNDLDKAKFVRRLQKAAVKDEKGRYLMVTVRRQGRQRSLPQNSTWHAWIHIMAVYAGETDRKMKRDVKCALLPMVDQTNPFTGEITREPISTRKLNKEQFSLLMERTMALAREHYEITLPSPDDPASFEAWQEYREAA